MLNNLNRRARYIINITATNNALPTSGVIHSNNNGAYDINIPNYSVTNVYPNNSSNILWNPDTPDRRCVFGTNSNQLSLILPNILATSGGSILKKTKSIRKRNRKTRKKDPTV